MNCFTSSYTELSFCHEENEKKRCRYCASLNTKKKGFSYCNLRTRRGTTKRKLQRYVCKDCGRSFCSCTSFGRDRFSRGMRYQAAVDYIATKSSLKEVAHQYHVSHQSIYNWVNQLGKHVMGSSVIVPEKWSGYISFDGKEIKLGKGRRLLFVASDAYTGFPFHIYLGEVEDRSSAYQFMRQAKEIYPVSVLGITSDFGKGRCFVSLLEDIFPGIPHQVCLVHYQRYVWVFLPRTRRSEFFWRNAVLKQTIKRIIKAQNRETSLYWLDKLIELKPFFRASYHQRFLRSVTKNYKNLTAHYDYPDLPQTTNDVENINRQLQRKLKNLDGFKSESSMNNFLKIWFQVYRMKHQKIQPDQWLKMLLNNKNQTQLN